MDDREELIGQLDQARSQMRELVERIHQSAELYPGWSIRQVLAHIAGWDEVLATALQAHRSRQEPELLPDEDMDACNARFVAGRENQTLAETRAEWEQARATLKERLLALSAEQYGRLIRYPWGGSASVARGVFILAHHEAEHAAELRQQIEDQAG